MRDPADRPPGTWPRDRPIRWGGVVRNLGWSIVASVALIAQLVLALPIALLVLFGPDTSAFGAAKLFLSLAWAGLTLFAAWSWVFGRWRVVLAPIATAGALWAVSVGFDALAG